jgi:DnaJ-class molecular chaperone
MSEAAKWDDFEFQISAKITCRRCKGTRKVFDIQQIDDRCRSCDSLGEETVTVPCYIGMGNSIVADSRFLEKWNARLQEKP